MRGYIYIILAGLCFVFPTLAARYHGQSGKFLVAYEMPAGSYFTNAVIYVINHGVNGATGVVIGNRIPKETLKAYGHVPQTVVEADVPIFEGGPVNKDSKLFLLKRHIADIGEASWQIYNYSDYKKAFNGSLEAEIIRSYAEDETPQYHLFSGVSGWFTMQLELEKMRNTWVVADSLEDGFMSFMLDDVDAIWHDAFGRAASQEKKSLGQIY